MGKGKMFLIVFVYMFLGGKIYVRVSIFPNIF